MTIEPELLRALGALCEPPDPAHRVVAAALDLPSLPDVAEHTDLFGMQLVPYAAVYLGPEGMLGGEAASRIAGFWRAVGMTPPAEPDHLAALLGLYAMLVEAEQGEPEPARRALRREARRALLWEHMLTWLPAYTTAVSGSDSVFYGDWAALLGQVLAGEVAELDPPATPAQHLRAVPELPGPDAETKDLVRATLTPVRSGLVLSRRDLLRGAHTGGLGLRVGERAFMLRAMLDQDAVVTFGWLATEADRWAARHQDDVDLLGAVAIHWRDRAIAMAADCRTRRDSLREVLADTSAG
ncbi:MAG: molecular chaperone TorD family protein [Actinobacteria bacterium]|nr:molecular chaperone TorD family protein [Actinomycetota bacterium]MBI3686396.1 molecular chaperone TorD family protein [Actinomycetota bacterium]